MMVIRLYCGDFYQLLVIIVELCCIHSAYLELKLLTLACIVQ
jgi:hypothetical protein